MVKVYGKSAKYTVATKIAQIDVQYVMIYFQEI